MTGPSRPSAGFHRAAGLLHRALFALLFLALVANFGFYARYIAGALRYPFELDYGEGIIWAQMAALGGRGMYTSVHEYPYLVFHYTPLYHLVSYVAATLFGDPLATGRAVSVLSTVLGGILVGWIVARVAGPETPRRARLAAGVVAALLIFAFQPLYQWSALMRVDMLALLLNLAGISLFMASISRPRLFYLAALAFILAMLAKQTTLSGALACFGVSLLARPALTLRVLAFSIAVGVACLAGLSWATGGEFLKHTVLYNANEFRPEQLVTLLGDLLFGSRYAFISALVASAVLVGGIVRQARVSQMAQWRHDLARHPLVVTDLVLLCCFLVGFVASLGLGKAGASVNYAIDWQVTWSLVCGVALVRLWRFAADAAAPRARLYGTALSGVMVLALTVHVYVGDAWSWVRLPSDALRDAQTRVLAVVRRTPGPIWSEDMTITMRAGKEVIAEPAIIADLAMRGVWDQKPFLAKLREHWFDVIVITHWPATHFTPEMRVAVEESYPIVEWIDSYTLYFPRGTVGPAP